jgi:hypothetical protein
MTRPLLDLLVGLLLAGAGVGAFSTRRSLLRPGLVVLATVVSGAVAALIFVGEAVRRALEAGAVGFGQPGQPTTASLLTGAALIAAVPTGVAAGRMLVRARRAAALRAPAPAGAGEGPGA